MKILYFVILVFFFVQPQYSNAAVVRKQPAYLTPVYSNSYLPAAMQVIFHAVGQLKVLQNEEVEQALSSSTMTIGVPTSPHAPGQHQPNLQHSTGFSITSSEASLDSETPTELIASVEVTTASSSSLTVSNEVSTASPLRLMDPNEVSTASAFSMASVELSTVSSPLTASVHTSELSVMTYDNTDVATEKKSQGIDVTTTVTEAETPEENYATPETNHEIQEPVQETQEPVHEMAESNHEMADSGAVTAYLDGSESDVQQTTVLSKEENSGEDSSEESDDEKNSSEESKEESHEPKSISSEESEQEEVDSSEEEDEEIRFTLIGEKVSQVPRPSLSNYLRKTVKVSLSSSVQELAALYDALSKDARRQGLAKYSGYSDEVLKTLQSSAEGGIGPQLRILLEKTLERKELTRDDAKTKLSSTLKKLNDPGTILSRDLRRLIPLRYVP